MGRPDLFVLPVLPSLEWSHYWMDVAFSTCLGGFPSGAVRARALLASWVLTLGYMGFNPCIVWSCPWASPSVGGDMTVPPVHIPPLPNRRRRRRSPQGCEDVA